MESWKSRFLVSNSGSNVFEGTKLFLLALRIGTMSARLVSRKKDDHFRVKVLFIVPIYLTSIFIIRRMYKWSSHRFSLWIEWSLYIHQSFRICEDNLWSLTSVVLNCRVKQFEILTIIAHAIQETMRYWIWSFRRFSILRIPFSLWMIHINLKLLQLDPIS